MPKLIRVAMLGSGTADDPWRVPLPKYDRLVRDDETPVGAGAPRWAIVEIPDEDYEPPADGEVEQTVNVPDIGTVIRGLAPAQRLRMRERIRRRYRERALDLDVDPR